MYTTVKYQVHKIIYSLPLVLRYYLNRKFADFQKYKTQCRTRVFFGKPLHIIMQFACIITSENPIYIYKKKQLF